WAPSEKDRSPHTSATARKADTALSLVAPRWRGRSYHASIPLTMLALLLWFAFAASSASAASPPESYDALVQEAVRARGEGRLEESLALLESANAMQPSPGLRNNIARVLEELGRWSEAVEEYRSVAGDAT